MNVQKMIESLPLIYGEKVQAIIKDEDKDSCSGNLMIIADGIAADYYGEQNNGCPWISPKLESFARKHNTYWEWQNPEVIVLYNL